MKKVIFSLCVLMLIMCIIGCSSEKQTQTAEQQEQTTETAQNTSDNEDWTEYVQGQVITPTYNSTEEKTYTIDTKYVKLTYPEKWKDKVRYEINEYEPYTVSFYGYTGAMELPLFDLIFGESDEFLLGTLKTDSETIPLHVRHYDMENVGISNEDYENWLAMNEDINVIIAELVSDYGFQIA